MALAIEIFHKASLVHDDVEDDDPFRYGQPALHRKHGVAAAVNVGDYLIGLGYRLAAAQRGAGGRGDRRHPGPARPTPIRGFAKARAPSWSWHNAPDQDLTPLEALRISALKTAPAFEAALDGGVRLAGPTAAYREPIARFARHLGVAYQILNDLDDWQLPQPSGRPGGSDLLHGRPTVLWALALANLPPQDRLELRSLVAAAAGDPDALERGATAGLPSSAVTLLDKPAVAPSFRPADRLERARRLYQQAGVFPRRPPS